jgi:hypothetical protein
MFLSLYLFYFTGAENPSRRKRKADTPLTLRTVNELLFRRLLSYSYLILYILRVDNIVIVHARDSTRLAGVSPAPLPRRLLK